MNTVILGGSSFVGVYVASELLSKRGGGEFLLAVTPNLKIIMTN